MSNEVRYEKSQESAAIGKAIAENLQAILDHYGVETVRGLNRSLYKYTECGASLGVKLHDGTWRYSGDLEGIPNGNVRQLLVGSIVEGSDVDVTADAIDLADPRFMDEGGENIALDTFNATVQWVNDEACRLWDEANEGEKS